MRTRFIVWFAAAFLVALTPLRAQAPATSPIPRAADGKPDFSGFWDNPKPPGGRGAATVFDKSKMSPFKPGGEKLFYEPRTGDPRHDEPRAFCMPSGFPSAFLGPYPIQMIQTPKYLVMTTEFMNVTRIIPLDGRPHIGPQIRSWMGDSRGRWEGNTLVVETTNFIDRAQFRGAGRNMHLVERFTRTGPDTLSYEFTVTDPTTFTRPWTAQVPLIASTGPIYEWACHEHNYGLANILSAARAEERAAGSTR